MPVRTERGQRSYGSAMTLVKRLFVFCVAIELLCGYAAARNIPAPSPDKDASKVQIRDNAVSLLDDLMGDEKEVSKLLIIKHPSTGVADLIKRISKTADDAQKHLEELAKADPTLKLNDLQLPPGEKAVRDAMSKTKEHELLLSFGTTFELNLLLTQSEAMSYASHLAKVAADYSSSSAQQGEFHTLDESFDRLYHDVVKEIRELPRK